MVGTSREVLLWITQDHRYASLLGMSRQRLVGMRKRLLEDSMSEDVREELLLRLGSRIERLTADGVSGLPNTVSKLRGRYVLPAIVKDKHGKLFTELAFVRMCSREKRFDLSHVVGAISRGQYPQQEVVRGLLNAKGWTIHEPRMVLPSVWEVRA